MNVNRLRLSADEKSVASWNVTSSNSLTMFLQLRTPQTNSSVERILQSNLSCGLISLLECNSHDEEDINIHKALTTLINQWIVQYGLFASVLQVQYCSYSTTEPTKRPLVMLRTVIGGRKKALQRQCRIAEA